MKRLSLLALMCVWCYVLVAQIKTDPAIIQSDYKGKITITFDPKAGNAGMASATKCYAHTGYCTATQNWQGVIGKDWRSPQAPQLTKVGDKWQLVINNMYAFYSVPSGTEITALAFVFHDGPGGSLEGKTAGGQDIFIVMGEESVADIWESVEGVAPITKTRPSGIDQGIYYGSDGTSVTLCTYAASKTEPAKRVFLLGDMTNWKLSKDYQLYRDGNYFWIQLTGLQKGKEYRFQYAIERADGIRKQISDLYSEKVIHPDDKWEPKAADPTLIDYPLKGADGGYVTVIQPGKAEYQWSDATKNFKRPDKNNLVIYELWVYDYVPNRRLKGVLDRLDYIQQLGVNAIELMPICEFDGNYNWGYSPNHYFAPDRAYGSEKDFKNFIDECHKRGIAVILDMVFNHATGLNPMDKLYPESSAADFKQNPWFNVNPPHGDNVYQDWNHDFEPAHNMFIRALQYWLKEYKVDGYRLDLSHGLCGPSYNAVKNLKDYYAKGVKAVSPSAFMILEHWGGKAGEDRPQLQADGMLCWLNLSEAYQELTMGWMGSKDNISGANQDGFVTYCESHDEERMQYKAKKWGSGDVTKPEVRLNRIAASVIMNVLLNGSHMIWQYEEIGYDFSINSDDSNPNGDNEQYRCNTKPRPEGAGYFRDANRVAAYEKCAKAIQLRTKLLPNVFAGNPTAQSLGAGTKVRYVQWGSDVYVVANFDPASAQTANLPSGTWYDYFAGGTKMGSNSVSLNAGEVKIFTGKQLAPPTIDTDLEHLLSVENYEWNSTTTGDAVKFIRNGQLYIQRNGVIYNLQGARVE